MRDTVGPYKLLDRIGADSLGETFRARDTARGRTAFVRLIHPQIAADPAKRAALVADATKAASISHPSIAALFDIIDEGTDLALAHEHVEGRTLASTLGGTALNPRMAVAIGIQVADGLAELHANEITHGAVDASQIVINPRGQAKLLDAGLTSWLAATPRSADDITAIGALLASMTGAQLPHAQWADDLRQVLERTRPEHPRRFQSVATLAAELRSISAMLEARADAAAPANTGSGTSVVLWGAIALVLLALGVWLLLR